MRQNLLGVIQSLITVVNARPMLSLIRPNARTNLAFMMACC